MRFTPPVRRVVGVAAAAMLLSSALAVPASAVQQGGQAIRAVDAASTSGAAAHVRGPILHRGHVNATKAAKTAVGITRPATKHATLGAPAPTSVAPAGHLPRMSGSTTTSSSASPAVVPGDLPIIGWGGLSQSPDAIDSEPPDPWIAVSPSFVLQSVNGFARMYDRSGNTLLTIPMWALFSLAPGEHDADPRIIWDASHGRWVGVLLSYTTDVTDDLTSAYLDIAVSDGADPRGSWSIISYGYGDGTNPTLPDYPGLASSTTAIVVTANEWDHTQTNFIGASMLVLNWADVLTGYSYTYAQWTAPDPSIITIRPAIIQGSTSAVVHLVAVATSDGSVLYQRLSTPATPPTWSINLTTADGLASVSANAPVPPHQPGSPSTIEKALEAWLTDAVWHNNKLAMASTFGNTLDSARVTVLDTTTTIPTKVSDLLVDAPVVGVDSYMPGIGFTQSGTLITAFTASGPSDAASTWTAALAAPYTTWSTPTMVDQGQGNYSGTRWGDYVGVAVDPLGIDTVWVADEYAAADTTWATSVVRLSVDATGPAVTAPVQSLVAGTTLGSYTVPVKATWTASDPGSGVYRSYVGMTVFGNPTVGSHITTGTSLVFPEWWKFYGSSDDSSYQYAVYGIDNSGNLSAETAYGATLTATVVEQTKATYTGTWSTQSGKFFSNGNTKYSSKAGSTASFKTSGRSFAFVTTKASSRGKAKVYVDGVLKTTLTLTSSTTRYRNLAYVLNYAASGTHTIKVVVISGRVDVDAFLVLR